MGAPPVLPRADRRANTLAALDLLGGRYAGVTPEDRADAATVELPHLWEAIEPYTSGQRYVCRTCGGRIADCAGDRRQARDALLARTRGTKARPGVPVGGRRVMRAEDYDAAERARQAACAAHPDSHAARQARLQEATR